MSRPPTSPSSSQTRLGDLLWRRGLCDRNAIRRALALQARSGDRLGTHLLASGWISEKDLALALGEQLGVHAAYGDLIGVTGEALAIIDAATAAKHLVVPHHIENELLFVLMVQPHDENALDALKQFSQREISPVVVCEARMWELLRVHYDIRSHTRAIIPLEQSGLETSTMSAGETDTTSEIMQTDADPMLREIVSRSDEALVSPSLSDKAPSSQQPESQTPQARYEQLFQDFPDQLKPDGYAEGNASAAQPPSRQSTDARNEVISIGGRTMQTADHVSLEDALSAAPTPSSAASNGTTAGASPRVTPSRKMHAMVKKFQTQESTADGAPPPPKAEISPATSRQSEEDLKALYQQLLHPANQPAQAQPIENTASSAPTSPPGETNEEPTERLTPPATPPALQGNYRKELGRRLQGNTQKSPAPITASARTTSPASTSDVSILAAGAPPPEPTSLAGSAAAFLSSENAPQQPSLSTTSQLKSSTDDESRSLSSESTPLASAIVQRTDFAQKIFQQTPTRFRRLALLTVHTDQITVWDAEGDLPVQRVRNFCVARDTNSVFQWVAESLTPYVGPLQSTPANELWVDASGGQRPKSVVVLPIVVQGIVAHLLYGDNGQDQHVSSDIAELSSLAQRISDAYGLATELAQQTPNTE